MTWACMGQEDALQCARMSMAEGRLTASACSHQCFCVAPCLSELLTSMVLHVCRDRQPVGVRPVGEDLVCTVPETHLPGWMLALHPDRLARALQVIHACPAAHGGGGPRGPDPPGAFHNAIPAPAAAAAAAGPVERGPPRAAGKGWPQPLGAQHQVLACCTVSCIGMKGHSWEC